MTKSKGILPYKPRKNLLDRFWEKVDIRREDECWEWQASIDKVTGYGRFNLYGNNEHAQRVSWVIVYGHLDKEFHVLHKCDNRKCVNPKHLFLGTNLDNIQDKISKSRQSKGIERPAHKLNDKKIQRIRSLHKSGMYSQSALSKIFGVSDSQISLAVNYKSWRHVT